jgi:RNA polymerase sigma factor (sigma-70 family)
MSHQGKEYWRTTGWTIVQHAGASEGHAREQAWRLLFERYRSPVENTLRYWLRGHPQVEDAVSDFFSHLLLNNVLPKADRTQGRFRGYLQGVIRNYAKQWRRQMRAQASGSEEEQESLLGLPNADDGLDEVEQAEEQAWAKGLLAGAIGRLIEERPRDGSLLLRAWGLTREAPLTREELAASAELKPNALDQALFRARKRLRELVLEDIAQTVGSDADFEAEKDLVMRRLFAAHPDLSAPD